MNCLKSFLFVFLSVSFPIFASPREVALLNFRSDPATFDGISGEPLPFDPQDFVSPAMRTYFQGGPLDGVNHGFEDEGPANCDGVNYVPTWWLSREVEVRRAMYFNALVAIACDFGIPTSLLDAVISQESGYNPWAVSSAGAMGIMQIMPGTARSLGLATPFDALSNMRAGARYLREQLDRFGRVDLALAAYNAGPERHSLQQGYVPAIPETLNYVRTITTNWARLAALGKGQLQAADRTFAALSAVRASGYRDVELIRYDGLN